MKIDAADKILDLARPRVMGVLNVTPDSFSDGGEFFAANDAIRHAERMVADGAAIIDVGGESTRPGARQLTEQEELDRVLPVLEAIVKRFEVVVSIDTSTAAIMTAAAEVGAAMINDVYALRREGALAAAAATNCAICLVHMQGEPRAMQDNPTYADVVKEVGEFLSERVSACLDRGVARSRLIVDPGFGFGKTVAHNMELLASLGRLEVQGLPILVGLSRKSTLGKITGRDVAGRLPAGVAAAVLAVERGASIIRTHDVAATVDALKIAAAVREAQT